VAGSTLRGQLSAVKTSTLFLEHAILILLSLCDAMMEHLFQVHGWIVEIETVEARRIMVM
jgi:hypothetical protein